jgi:glycine/D-amino acid oxidase-like deaminating enzyme
MRVVICGGGVVGACLAYFLSLRHGVEAVVVERRGVACAASGKAGGFLALDWCDGTPLGPLARRSFALHAGLAADLGGEERWGYRRLDTLAVAATARGGPDRRRGATTPPGWLGDRAVLRGRLGTPETTAQVHPARFTGAVMDAAVARGARLHLGTVGGIALTPDGSAVTGAVVDGEVVPADAVVVAMGPWSALACRWLPLPAVRGLKGNSLLLRTGAAVVPGALFAEVEDGAGEVHAPEVFPRPDGTTYVCGLSSEAPLPEDPAEVGPDPGAPERLRAIVRAVAPALGGAEVLEARACHRPVTADGLPLLGRVPGVAGAYVATGHGPWGILNAPASGEALAGLVADGEAGTVDLGAYDPARLPMWQSSAASA